MIPCQQCLLTTPVPFKRISEGDKSQILHTIDDILRYTFLVCLCIPSLSLGSSAARFSARQKETGIVQYQHFRRQNRMEDATQILTSKVITQSSLISFKEPTQLHDGKSTYAWVRQLWFCGVAAHCMYVPFTLPQSVETGIYPWTSLMFV